MATSAREPHGELTSRELLTEAGDMVVGLYLSPPRLLGDYSPDRPFDGLLVELAIPIDDHVVLVSRTSGLFVKVPDELPPYLQPMLREFPDDDDPKWQVVYRRTAFVAEAARLFNLVLCEMAFEGIVSAPASSVQMGSGYLVRGTHPVITGGSGGREAHLDRAIYASNKVQDGSALLWQGIYGPRLERVLALGRVRRLEALSSALPELIVGAYSNLSLEHLPEAIVDSWVVTEQILDAYWEEHARSATETGRAATLRDRSFTAAVRAEVLLTAGRISPALWKLATVARGHRNKLAHRAEATQTAARATAEAMHAALEAWLGESVAHPQSNAFLVPERPRRAATPRDAPRTR